MKKRVLIGGAWPYANYNLHIGHLVALLPADIIARFHRNNGAEVVYIVINVVELVVGICVVNALDKGIQTSESPLIDLGEIFKWYSIGVGIEIAEICKKNADGISDLAVNFGKLF